jgi:hypothetical protein
VYWFPFLRRATESHRSGVQNYSCIARIFSVGNDWAKVMAILNFALHSAIWIPVNFLRLRIIVAHFAQTVSEHVILFACNRTRTERSYVF